MLVMLCIIIPMLVIWVVLSMGVRGLRITKKVILRDGIFLIAAELMLLVLLSSDKITYWHGAAFTAFYFVYLGYTVFSMKKNEEESEDDVDENDDDEERS